MTGVVEDFSPASAAQAAERGELARWVDAFLRGPGGNTLLASGLRLEERAWSFVAAQPLGGLRRVCGPEDGMDFPESRASFESRLLAMQRAVLDGWTPPPLIVRLPDLVVSDGNHRLELLRRMQRSHHPALLWASARPRHRSRL